MDRKQMAGAVVDALRELEVTGPYAPYAGICSNVSVTLFTRYPGGDGVVAFWEEEREAAFLSWKDPMASGDEVYPILGNYIQPVVMMWDRGAVAAARWRLVYHLINHFTFIAEEAE